MSTTSEFTTAAEISQHAPITWDMNEALNALSEMVPLLPDSHVMQGREMVRRLYGIVERVQNLETITEIVFTPGMIKEGA